MNHRFTTVATKTNAIEPAPTPTKTPQSRINCHEDFIKIVKPDPSPTEVSALMTTRRTPNFSISAAANGAVKPKSNTFIPTAKEMIERDHPNSSSKGTISTEGAERMPAAPINVKKVIPAAIQAGCNRLLFTLQPYGRIRWNLSSLQRGTAM